MAFSIIKDKKPATILVENEAYEGVKKIAQVVKVDIEEVADTQVDLVNDIEKVDNENLIIFATVGHSQILEKLSKNEIIDISVITKKSECYELFEVDFSQVNDIIGLHDIDRISRILLAIGSDKRGTIYGMFHISEACGVTSLEYMGDCKPPIQDSVMLTTPFISKQPSVKYRGFFINDEWPAFGNWSMEQFGGINARCYEKLFIFLLRMKGNLIWPAMWSSVFSEDGPGIESAKLADTLGVIMGTSHHEPLCRAGEEWQRIYNQYGDSNEWNFTTNGLAIKEFWKDGMLRNKDYENLVTIGMRGEADSKLLDEEATMADNIKVVKDAILAQHEIIRECVDEDISKIPRVLAIYKEVEDYYYGDDTCEGLKDWDELSDVIFLLSDDNWGNTRGLPTNEERNHPGGYGMYYHFDYHGGPISYEWQSTSRLSKTWEQMTQAYEYGIREEWIVNVGDLKGNEYPLTYFMALAYDYEKWSRHNVLDEYMSEWVDMHFHHELDADQKTTLLEYVNKATSLIALRKPEALHSRVFSAFNLGEADRIALKAMNTISMSKRLRDSLNSRCKDAFDSLFFYQYSGSLTILLMQLYAGLNEFFSMNRSLRANMYANKVKECISDLESIIESYNRMLDGKWNHMMDSGFTGFRSWDDYDWGYPVVSYVTPINKPKVMAGFEGLNRFHLGSHWQDGARICDTSMIRGDKDDVVILLDSRGSVDFDYKASSDSKRIEFINGEGHVDISKKPFVNINVFYTNELDYLILDEEIEDELLIDNAIRIDETNEEAIMSQRAIKDCINIDIDIKFADGTKTVAKLAIEAAGIGYLDRYLPLSYDPDSTFVENEGVICIDALHYSNRTTALTDEEGEYHGWDSVKYLGREGYAMKCFPTIKDYTFEKNPPMLEYMFIAMDEGIYTLEIDILSRNPVVTGENMYIRVAMNDDESLLIDTLGDNYYASHTCPLWCQGVLDNVRRVRREVEVKGGINYLRIFAASPNVSFDKIILYNSKYDIKETYLGPEESSLLLG